MSFYNIIKKIDKVDLKKQIVSCKAKDVERALLKESREIHDYMALISPAADNYLEEMAQLANRITLRHFGKTVLLYTPMYLSNYCVNSCLYCGFNNSNNIKRGKLNAIEVEDEAKFIANTGIRHILILTGEDRIKSSPQYIEECVKVIKNYFSSISIEIYPLTCDEYKHVINAGVDGLTIYQEVYDLDTYKLMHVKGPKHNYVNRLDAPERACIAGIRSVNIGALLGLDDLLTEAFYTGLHANYLQTKYLGTDLSVSFPRLRPCSGMNITKTTVNDRDFVKLILAMRLFLPTVGITLSTRESKELRDNLLGLGITRMSAGSSTKVGGHAAENNTEEQFKISDERGVNEVAQMLIKKGYDPIFKDWEYCKA